MPVVLVTGASAGIGRETAKAFARRGYRVFGAARHPSAEEAIIPIPLDVTRDASVEQAVASVLRQAGAIDVLVNNAGIGGPGPIESLAIESAKALFETNYFGAIRMIRAVLPGMRERRSGAIVNVSSVMGRITWAAHGHYGATKHALEAATEALAAEVLPFGVRVAIIEPGVVLTSAWSKPYAAPDPASPYIAPVRRLWRHFHAQLDEPLTADTVAAAVLHAVETDAPRLRYLVGEDARSLVAGRDAASDEEWIALQAEVDDDRFVEESAKAFGIDLYNPPSANSRTSR